VLAPLLAIALLGSGCAMNGTSAFNLGMTNTAGGKAFPRTELGLLAFSNYISNVSGSQLDAELNLAEKNYRAKRDDYNMLWLAIVLMQPHAAPASNQMAVRLLRDYVNRSKTAADYRFDRLIGETGSYDTLAEFLLNSTAQRQRLLADNATLRQKIEKLMLIESSLNYPQVQTHIGAK
jgi:hypothetical protein|tara:strand:+ start:1470 stop:2003 length:534 start_codon:yes stop_codon:yes gene_type:complete